MDQQSVDQNAYTESAVRAIQNKKQIPEIDFTLHTMEDGSTVNTQERVCKGRLIQLSCANTSNTVQMYKRPPSTHPPKTSSSPPTTDQSPTSNFSSSTSTEKVV